MVESLPQGSATYVAENNSWKLIVWPNPGRGCSDQFPVHCCRCCSLPVQQVGASAWKSAWIQTSCGNVHLETRWGLLYPLASQQREKFNTPHTKIASESVQCEISCQILSQDRKAQFLYLCARFSVYDPFHWLLSRLIRRQLPQVCNWSNIIISKLREDFGGLVH